MEKNLKLNIKFIQEKLVEGFEYTDIAKNKDLVLLIGNTGVGKSTTGNYLMGCEMVIEENDVGGEVISTVDKDSPFKIGHTSKSETLYATPVSRSSFSWCLVDCPGFLGNRTVEERIVESISTELAIRNGTQVKGIVVLAELSELEAVRSDKFLQLIRTLISIFKDPTEMINYTTFVITKKSEYMPIEKATKNVLVGIRQLSKYCETQLSAFQNPQVFLNNINEFSESEYLVASEYLKIMERKINEFVFIDPLDNGQSRQRVIDKINGFKQRKGILDKLKNKLTGEGEIEQPITIEDFNFNQYDKYRTKFNVAIYDLANNANAILDKIVNGVNLIKESRSEQDDLEKRCEDTNTLIHDLKKREEMKFLSDNESSEESFPSQEIVNREESSRWQKIVNRNHHRITDLEEYLKDLNKVKDSYESKLIELNKPKETILYRENSLNEKAWWFRGFSWFQMDFSMNTEGKFPIAKIEKGKENGEWYNEDDRKNDGIYSVTYKSNYRPRPAKAYVKAHIYKKDEPGNALEIETLKAKRADVEINIRKYNSEIAELENTNQILTSDIAAYSDGQRKTAEQYHAKIIGYEKDIEKYGKRVEECKNIILQARNKGKELLAELSKMHNQCNTLIKISGLLQFPSSLITDFPKKYKKVTERVDEYRKLFENEMLINQDNEEVIDDKNALLDPITKKIIKTPVIVHGLDGVVFDESSLIKKLTDELTDEKINSFIFDYEGRNIEIKLHGWTRIESPHKRRLNPSSFFEKPDQENYEKLKRLEEELEELEKQVEEKKLAIKSLKISLPNKLASSSRLEADSVQIDSQRDMVTNRAKNLMLQNKIIPNHNGTIFIVFNEIEQAKLFQSALFEIGIVNTSMTNEPRKIYMPEKKDSHEYTISLIPEEFNSVLGENAYEKLISKDEVNQSVDVTDLPKFKI